MVLVKLHCTCFGRADRALLFKLEDNSEPLSTLIFTMSGAAFVDSLRVNFVSSLPTVFCFINPLMVVIK